MSEVEQKIEELRREVEDNLKSRALVCGELGRFLLDSAEGGEGELPMEEYRSAATEIASRISLMEQQVDEIDGLEESYRGLREQESSLKERKKTGQDNLSLLQETLGEELFHLLNSQDMDVPWKSAFDPLFKSISRIRDSESEIYQTENQVRDKNLFTGLIRRSRMSVLKTRKKSMEHSLTRLYQSCLSDALNMGAGRGEGKDAEVLAPFFRADRELQSILKEEQGLEDEKQQNRDRLKELCGARGPKKRAEFLDKEKDAEELRLREALEKWGQAVTGDTPEIWKDLDEVKDAIEKIDKLTEQAIALNLEIEKWEARRDIEKLRKDREYMSGKIAALEEEIQARRQEIRVLKKEMNAAEKDIAKKRGFIGEDEDSPESVVSDDEADETT